MFILSGQEKITLLLWCILTFDNQAFLIKLWRLENENMCPKQPTTLHFKLGTTLTLFDIGRGGHDGLQNVFDHCAQTFSRRKLKLDDF